MAAIRWVCVSDLHLGALNSVLSPVAADGEAIDPARPSPALETFRDTLHALGTGDPPQLVVLGDLFELALNSTDDAGRAFGQFVQQLGIGTDRAVVAPVIRFVPGNHDHHLWVRARGECFLDHVAQLPADQPFPTQPHVTHLLPRNDPFPVRDRLVELLAARGQGATVQVESSYPNLGLTDETGSRAVVLSHGHYVEPLYRAMSHLNQLVGEVRTGLPPVAELEAENGAWIDFFWSSMGDSGDVGGWSRTLYESLQDPAVVHAELGALGRSVASGRARVRSRLEGLFAEGVLSGVMAGVLRRERHHPDVLSPRAEVGLNDYLAGPVATQVAEELGDPGEISFVFGHTHKPFVERRAVAGRAETVTVMNTGGWVADTPEPEVNKGASLVVVDEELNVAAIRVYRQGTEASPVTVSALDGKPNPLVDRLGELIDSGRDPWHALAQATHAAAMERARQLDGRLQREHVQIEEAGDRRHHAHGGPTPKS